ncbi:hypothetical protein Tco_1200945 [Tanacetum coccineum]
MLCKPKSFYDEKNKVAIGYKNPLCLTRAKQAQSALYNGHVLVTTNHTPTVIHDSEDTREIAEITRKRMLKKAETSVLKPISALTVYPPNTPVKLVPRILPTKSQVKINLYVLTQLFTEFDKTCKTRITPTGITEGERGFEQTKRCYLTEVIPFFKTLKEHFVGVQTALFKEVKEMEEIFDQMNNEVNKNTVDKQCAEIEKKNLLIENENLIVNCLSTQLLYDVEKSRCLDLEADMSKVHDESKHISKLEGECLNLQLKYQHLQESFDNHRSHTSQEASSYHAWVLSQVKDSSMLNEIESSKVNCEEQRACFTSDYVNRPKVLAPGIITPLVIQNGVVERRNVINGRSSMYNDWYSRTLLCFYGKKCSPACFTTEELNRSSLSHTRITKPLMSLCMIRALIFHSLRVYWCSVLSHIVSDNSWGKFQAEADIGIFVGYAPSRKGYRIYNQRTRRLMETIHVTFDEMHQSMAFVRISSGPTPFIMTPVQLKSGLAPIDKELEMLFQPMFNEHLEQSRVNEPVPSATEIYCHKVVAHQSPTSRLQKNPFMKTPHHFTMFFIPSINLAVTGDPGSAQSLSGNLSSGSTSEEVGFEYGDVLKNKSSSAIRIFIAKCVQTKNMFILPVDVKNCFFEWCHLQDVVTLWTKPSKKKHFEAMKCVFRYFLKGTITHGSLVSKDQSHVTTDYAEGIMRDVKIQEVEVGGKYDASTKCSRSTSYTNRNVAVCTSLSVVNNRAFTASANGPAIYLQLFLKLYPVYGRIMCSTLEGKFYPCSTSADRKTSAKADMGKEFTQGIQTFFSPQCKPYKPSLKDPKKESDYSHHPLWTVFQSGLSIILASNKPTSIYLKMVAENTKKTPQESASVQPATKRATPKKPTTTTPVKQTKPAPPPSKKPFQAFVLDVDDVMIWLDWYVFGGAGLDVRILVMMVMMLTLERAIKLSMDYGLSALCRAPVGKEVTIRDRVLSNSPKLL